RRAAASVFFGVNRADGLPQPRDPYQLIHEQTGRDHSQRDRYRYNLSPGPSRDRFARLDLGFEFDSFRRNLKRPRKNQPNRKAEDDDDDKYLHHPWRRVESRKENRRRLKQEPPNDRIRDRDLVNVAPLQLGEEVVDLHRGLPEKIRVMSCLKRGSLRKSSRR